MKSLSAKLTLWYAIAATGTAAAFLGFGRFALERNFIAGIDLLNDAEYEEVLPRLENLTARSPAAEVARSVRKHTELDAAMFFFQIDSESAGTVFRSSNLGERSLVAGETGKSRYTINDPEMGELRVARYTLHGLEVRIASSLQNYKVLDANLLQVAGLTLVAVFAASVGIGYAMSRYALNPIADMQRTASRITATNLCERIDVGNASDEVARLGAFLNQMFDRLQASFQQVQRFTADASHELKTPLSLIRLNAEALLAKPESLTPDQRKLLDAQLDEVERLNRVTNDLLILSKADAGMLRLNFERHDTGRFVEDFSADAQALCEDKGVRFALECKTSATACFDAVWIRHTLFNLLSNALKFSPEGSLIALSSMVDDVWWTLEMRDEGPGIGADQLERIFDRFYRGSAVSQDPKGSGLGLALCRSIAHQHNGSIVAANREGRNGLKVTIRLPLRSKDCEA